MEIDSKKVEKKNDILRKNDHIPIVLDICAKVKKKTGI